MKNKILQNATKDIPLYLNDFTKFWDNSVENIDDDNLFEVYRGSLIVKNWKSIFHSLQLTDYDSILNEMHEDVNASLFLALLGMYRSAHMHMRSSIELTMQLLFFIHHPIEFKQWKEGNFIIKHDKLVEYLKNHPNFDGKADNVLSNMTRNWKHFSKYIHGESPVFFHCTTEHRETQTFSTKEFNIWKSNYSKNIYFLNSILYLFFSLEESRFPEPNRNLIRSLLPK